MDKSKIEKSIEDFRKEVQVLFKEGSKEPSTYKVFSEFYLTGINFSFPPI